MPMIDPSNQKDIMIWISLTGIMNGIKYIARIIILMILLQIVTII